MLQEYARIRGRDIQFPVRVANGKRDWIEDANGNRSDFTYDGHDRLIKLNFPSTTVGAHAANASDYEEIRD